jgi:hypothetical protein
MDNHIKKIKSILFKLIICTFFSSCLNKYYGHLGKSKIKNNLYFLDSSFKITKDYNHDSLYLILKRNFANNKYEILHSVYRLNCNLYTNDSIQFKNNVDTILFKHYQKYYLKENLRPRFLLGDGSISSHPKENMIIKLGYSTLKFQCKLGSNVIIFTERKKVRDDDWNWYKDFSF